MVIQKYVCSCHRTDEKRQLSELSFLKLLTLVIVFNNFETKSKISRDYVSL